MKPRALYATAGLLLLLIAVIYQPVAGKQPAVLVHEPSYLMQAEEVPKLAVSAYTIFDIATGEVLAAFNDTEVLPIASVTKLLTAVVALEVLPLEDVVAVKAVDLREEGHSGQLQVGETYTYRELLFPLLLASSNDTAAIFTRATSTNFLAALQSYAKAVGAEATTLADASGLSDHNTATAADLALLTRHIYQTQPHVFDITTLSKQLGPYAGWLNNSPLRQTGYQGGKHGYTEAAGRTAVTLYREPFPGGSRTLGYVVLGSRDLAGDMSLLREFVHKAVTLE